MIIIMGRGKNMKGGDKRRCRREDKVNDTRTRSVTQIVNTMKGGDTKGMDRVKDMKVMSIDNLSETNTIRIGLRAVMSEIMGESAKTSIEITSKKYRALRRKLGKSRNQLVKASRIIGRVARGRGIEIT